MTFIFIGGALVGLGVLLLALIVAPPRISPAVALAQLDSARGRARADRIVAAPVAAERVKHRADILHHRLQPAWLGAPMNDGRGNAPPATDRLFVTQ
jgi:hypothetical protein